MYEAIVTKIDTINLHPNADRLKLAVVQGFQVVVGLDAKVGDIGVFFPTDGQLSQEYCDQNDLIGYTDPITGEKKGGFFAKNRRVRSQKFRGERSDGYFTQIESFEYTGAADIPVGTRFTELNGHEICQKYVTPATKNAGGGGQKRTRKEYATFAKHIETEQYRYLDKIPENSIIYISEKVHGTSGRYGNCYVENEVPRTRLQKLLRRPAKVEGTYEHLLGTRNVVLDAPQKGYYTDETFRRNAVDVITLNKGEVIYFELVGYTTDGALIMGSQSTKDLKDKTFQKQYGDVMEYKYGQVPGTCGLQIYRITRVSEDGEAVDLSWTQVVRRCRELGLATVRNLYNPLVFNSERGVDKIDLDAIIESLVDGPSTFDESHIREGVVLRVESEFGIDFFKSKSFTFGLLEGYLKEKDDYVDTEESA